MPRLILAVSLVLLAGCAQPAPYDPLVAMTDPIVYGQSMKADEEATWTRLQVAARAEIAATRDPAALALLREARGLPLADRIKLIDDAVNYWPFAWTVTSQRWKTPVEVLHAGGECRDYATAKFFFLEAADVPSRDMRVVVGYDKRSGVYHAVLDVRVGDDWQRLNTATRVGHDDPTAGWFIPHFYLADAAR